MAGKFAARTAVSVAAATGTLPTTPSASNPEQCEAKCKPANAIFWNSLDHYRGEIRRSGSGSKIMNYTWDRLHECEVETFDRRGNHLGSVDAMTGAPIPGKGPKASHRLRL
jgi:hypothetical protein